MATITLRVLDGADRGKVYENIDVPVTIGREEGNTIQLLLFVEVDLIQHDDDRFMHGCQSDNGREFYFV